MSIIHCIHTDGGVWSWCIKNHDMWVFILISYLPHNNPFGYRLPIYPSPVSVTPLPQCSLPQHPIRKSSHYTWYDQVRVCFLEDWSSALRCIRASILALHYTATSKEWATADQWSPLVYWFLKPSSLAILILGNCIRCCAWSGAMDGHCESVAVSTQLRVLFWEFLVKYQIVKLGYIIYLVRACSCEGFPIIVEASWRRLLGTGI